MTGVRKLPAVIAAGTTLAALAAGLVAREASAEEPAAVIRYTEYGIPHITASSFGGLGEGYGYATAKDNLCVLADTYTMVNAERSLYFGPEGKVSPSIQAAATTNLNSDLNFQRINDSGVIERILDQPPPMGLESRVKDTIAGYVKGYNRYLAEIGGADGVRDPACHGGAWVRPITAMDVYRHAYSIIGQGGNAFIDGTVTAQPPLSSSAARARPARDAGKRIAAKLKANHEQGIGSNAIAAGADGVSEGKSVLLGNPHFPWQGSLRLWQAHLTIPGVANVSGAGLLGMPGTNIGHNENVAWSHTVSTALPVGLFDVNLVPFQPTKYYVDGKVESMTSRRVTVRVRNDDGTVGTVSRTLWSTRYGPVVTSVQGIPLPWAVTAHSVRDANANNLRALNTWYGLMTSKDSAEAVDVLKRTQGIPWVNTILTDRKGHATYTDIQVVPNVPDAKVDSCSTLIGKVTFSLQRLTILDGSRGGCGWDSSPDSIEPGLMPPDELPLLTRSDWVSNANDSPWLANPDQPLSYPKVVGDTGTARSNRTQEAILTAQRRLAGTDGLPGKGFSHDSMKQLLFADHSRVAELAAADTARMCSGFLGGLAPYDGGLIDVRSGCPALASWDHQFTLDSRGSLLFQRFWLKAIGLLSPWKVGFDPADPVNTPNTLATDRPDIWRAFGNAAAELRAAGLPLDAPLSAGQAVIRNGERIPVHGDPHWLGVLNVITPVWDAGKGNTEVVHGSSIIQVVQFDETGAPKASTLLTYSQSTDPTSPHFADQTRLFSQGQWVTGRFTEAEINASPALRTVTLN